jgi:hypothetical protein
LLPGVGQLEAAQCVCLGSREWLGTWDTQKTNALCGPHFTAHRLLEEKFQDQHRHLDTNEEMKTE